MGDFEMGITLDTVDRQILTALQQEPLTVAELADKLGMTPPPCWRRIRRLKEAGVLVQQEWLVNAEAVGLSLLVYATVKLAAHDVKATRAFRDGIKDLPEVLECYILLGGIDVLIKIVAKDIKSYEDFFYNKLSQLPGVREVTSSVAMTCVKSTLALPIDLI
jgi:Lrp/AsnC family transcriptional regulator